MNKKIVLLLLLLIVWMGLIFYFSSQTYEEQSVIHVFSVFNNTLVEKILQGFSFNYAGAEVSVYALGIEGFIDFFVRKSAHFFIFLVLGALTYALLSMAMKKRCSSVVTAFSFVVLYAFLDEFHQKLTGGRTPLLHDVVLDCVGGLCGILLTILFVEYRKNKQS